MVVFSRRALADLERLADFLQGSSPQTAVDAVRLILEATAMLELHPMIGRPVRGALRELVISFGKSGYVALYRLSRGQVQVLAARHQREAGFG